MKNRCVVLSFAARCVVFLLVSQVSLAQITVIRAGVAVDPATASVQRNQVILIESGKIKAIGAGLEVPAGAKLIDLSDRTVLPGLMDAHTHLAANIDPRWDLGDDWIEDDDEC